MLIINNIKNMGMFQFMKEKKSFVEKFFIELVSFNSKELSKIAIQMKKIISLSMWREEILLKRGYR